MSRFPLTLKNVVGIGIPAGIMLFCAVTLISGLYSGEIYAPPLGRARSDRAVVFSNEPGWYVVCSLGWLLATLILARISWVILQSTRRGG